MHRKTRLNPNDIECTKAVAQHLLEEIYFLIKTYKMDKVYVCVVLLYAFLVVPLKSWVILLWCVKFDPQTRCFVCNIFLRPSL